RTWPDATCTRSPWAWRKRPGRPPGARNASDPCARGGRRGARTRRLRPVAARSDVGRRPDPHRALRRLPPHLSAGIDDAGDVALSGRTDEGRLRPARHAVADDRRGADAPRLPDRARRHLLMLARRTARVG